MSLGMEPGLSPVDFVLDRDPAFPPQKGGGGSPPISSHVYRGQTARWMKVVLGMEVGLRPGDFVLDRDPVPFPQKEAELSSPIFASIVAKRLDASKCHLV